MITRSLVLAALAALVLPSCAHFGLGNCLDGGKGPLGQNVARIRSSQWRMKLDDASAASARFLAEAAMSALAYADGKGCRSKPRLTDQEVLLLEEILVRSAAGGPGWIPVHVPQVTPECENPHGFYYRVWKRDSASKVDVMISFRGTGGLRDWLYGNLHWFTRFFMQDQYHDAARHARLVLAHFKPDTGGLPRPLRFFTTGHSLGGGLAQHVLYANPRAILQAVVFDPTPVTGFVEQAVEERLAGCECARGPEHEPRITRVYESHEILSHLRFFHKLFFNPHRHIHEVRFNFSQSRNPVTQHSMSSLASGLDKSAREKAAGEHSKPWYAGRCTKAFEDAQQESCKRPASALWPCPA